MKNLRGGHICPPPDVNRVKYVQSSKSTEMCSNITSFIDLLKIQESDTLLNMEPWYSPLCR